MPDIGAQSIVPKRDPGAASDRRPTFVAIGVGALVVVASACVGRYVLLDFPNSADEFDYLFQAQLFASGRVYTVPHPLHELFEFFFLVLRDGRYFSLFPPGWPAVLALGGLAGAVWLTNPLLTGVAVFLVFLLARELAGSRTGLLALLLMAPTPWLIFNGASYHSHPLALLLAVGSSLLAVRGARSGRVLELVGAGLALGMLATTRYLDAAAVAPLVAFFVFWPLRCDRTQESRGRVREASRRCVALAFGLALPLGAFMAYNAALSGDALLLPGQYGRPGEGLGFGVYGHTPAKGFAAMLGRLSKLMVWTAPYSLVLAIVPLVLRRRAWSLAMAVSVLLLVGGYFLYWHPGGNEYGPRFYFTAFGFMALLAARGWLLLYDWLGARGKGWIAALVMGAMLLGEAVSFVQIGQIFNHQVTVRSDPFRTVEQAGLENAVVLLTTGAGGFNQMELTRNSPDFDDPVLYAIDMKARNRELMAHYPERTFYLYAFDHERERGRLTRVPR